MEKTRVLIIDDNKNLVSLIKDYFKNNQNIEVVMSAEDGKEGINLIEESQDKFDLILLDLILLLIFSYLYFHNLNA